MDRKWPIIALTGTSGAGKTNIKSIFDEILREQKIKAVYIEGDSFHKYTRDEMEELDRTNGQITHFSPKSNHLDLLENLFKQFSISGKGLVRQYAHSKKDSEILGIGVGCFSDWEELEPVYDILFYEGLHGGFEDNNINITKYVDLLIGITPSINLEWVQKIHRDSLVRGYSKDQVKKLIIKRLPDYLDYICPQFSRTDANLKRIPLSDLSDPFKLKEVPSDQNSLYMLNIKNKSIIQGLSTCAQNFDLFKEDSSNTTITVQAKRLKSLLEAVFLPIVINLTNQR